MRCYYLQLVQPDVSGSSSGIVCHYKNQPPHIRTFVTHFFFEIPLSWITSTALHMSLFCPPLLPYFLSKQCSHSLVHHSSCTDVGRIPNFVLIHSACQFWKGEAGQKIIGRTSHKSECGGSRCGCKGGCVWWGGVWGGRHWASPRPIWPLFCIEAISVVAITTIIHSYPCPCTHGRMSSESLNFIDQMKHSLDSTQASYLADLIPKIILKKSTNMGKKRWDWEAVMFPQHKETQTAWYFTHLTGNVSRFEMSGSEHCWIQ